MANSIKNRRVKLFGKHRPTVRPFDPQTDMWVMWAAYDLGSFPSVPKGLTLKEFAALVMAQVATRSKCLVIEDDCKYFKSGRGPACFVAVDNYGWRIEPHADFFIWSTPRMTLRCTVAFLHMVRHSGEIGVCVVRSLRKSVNLFRHAKDYVGSMVNGLYEIGRMPMGDPRGDEYLFSVKGSRQSAIHEKRGGKNAGTDGIGRGAGRGVQRDDSGGRPAPAGAKRDSELSGDSVSSECGREGDGAEQSTGRGDPGREIRPTPGRAVEAELAGAAGGVM